MARIPEDDLERLKRNVSLAELCRSRGIELKAHGRKDLIGKCPFHADENPSFVVSPDKNLFHCLGCGAAGSVIDLAMKLDGLDFRAAVAKLLTATGLVRTAADVARRKEVKPERAAQLLERVIAIYEKNFAEDPAGRKYLEGRGITDAGLFAQYRVGYSNGRLKEILPSSGPVWDELEALGVLLATPGGARERFDGCIVFPVFDADGKLTTLYGRFAGTGSKRHVFLPDRPTGLWNAAALKTYPEIVLVESVIDALSVMMAGHRDVVAIQGTNGLGDEDVGLLKREGVRKVTLLLDGDAAGRQATERLKEKLRESLAVETIGLPAGEDPNSVLAGQGAQGLARALEGSAAGQPAAAGEAAADAALLCGLRRYEVRGLEKGPRKLKVTVRIERAGKLHVDTLDFYSAKSRRILAMDLCRIFEETPETIEADLARLLKHCEALPETAGLSEPRNAPAQPLAMTAAERKEAEAFGKAPNLFDLILADFVMRGLIGEEANKLLGYLAMTSRKRDTPLSVLILSASGAGKTALQDAALAFCPPEDLVKLTALSGKALFYKERLSLKNKVLALEEGDGAEEASYAIRNLISAGELTSESTIKDPASGRLITMANKVEGPCSVFLTTTNPEVDPETKSRFWVTSIDESREQTRKILSFQRRQHLSDGPIATPEHEAVLRKHRNFQRLLKPLAVKNPYAAQLAYGDDRLQGRRDQPKYLNLIKAIAFLRQMQKPVRAGVSAGRAVEYVEVDKDDIRLANRLAHELLGHSLDEMSRPSRDLLALLEEMRGKGEQLKKENQDKELGRPSFSFRRRDIREYTGWSNYRIHIHLKELVEFEYLAVESGRNGAPYRYRLAWDGQGKDGGKFLLGLKDAAELTPPGASG